MVGVKYQLLTDQVESADGLADLVRTGARKKLLICRLESDCIGSLLH